MNEHILPGMRDRGIVDETVMGRWQKHADHASSDVLEALWIGVSFEIWAQLYVDRKPISELDCV